MGISEIAERIVSERPKTNISYMELAEKGESAAPIGDVEISIIARYTDAFRALVQHCGLTASSAIAVLCRYDQQRGKQAAITSSADRLSGFAWGVCASGLAWMAWQVAKKHLL